MELFSAESQLRLRRLRDPPIVYQVTVHPAATALCSLVYMILPPKVITAAFSQAE